MIIGFLKKRQKEKSELPKTVSTIRGIELTIIHNFSINSKISVSKDDMDKIARIICEEKDSKNCGYIIAERVAKEVNPETIRSVDVEGSEDGKTWNIKLSNVPF